MQQRDLSIVLTLKAFLLERAAPISLLWAAISLAVLLLPPVLGELGAPHGGAARVPLGDFLDRRLLTLLLVGLVMLSAVFRALKLVLSYGVHERHNEEVFFVRVWDEVSSAATHLAFGNLALWATDVGQPNSFPFAVAPCLALALITFKGHKAVEPPEA